MIISIIGWASVALLLIDIIQHFDIYEKLPDKPFYCDMCIAFWISLIPNVWNYGGEGLLLSAITGITANILFKIQDRL